MNFDDKRTLYEFGVDLILYDYVIGTIIYIVRILFVIILVIYIYSEKIEKRTNLVWLIYLFTMVSRFIHIHIKLSEDDVGICLKKSTKRTSTTYILLKKCAVKRTG
ncbi:hypothetical protein ACJX0J_039752, partial [Zea mays]